MKAVLPLVLLLLVLLAGCSSQKQREHDLRKALYEMRNAIDQYTMDKHKAPKSLQEIVAANYLTEVPEDPITRSRETWVVEMEDVVLSVKEGEPGITNVRSGSDGIGSDGTKYSTW